MLKDNLLMLRNLHCFSQEAVAEKVGVSRQAYAKWESGKTVPDIEKCSLLAELYDVTLDSLIAGEDTADGYPQIPRPKGKNIWGAVTINERGQILIPKAAREHFGLKEGQRLILLSDDRQGFALMPAESFENMISYFCSVLEDSE